MSTVILNALSIFIVLALAMLLKQFRLVRSKDGLMTSKLVVYITLPATIIIGVNHSQLSATFFILMVMGLFSNLALIFIGKLLSSRRPAEEQALYMFNLSGFNIGNFSIPFVSSFFPVAIPFLAMFDMGNSLMVTGGSQALIEGLSGRKKSGFIPREVAGVLLRNPPFVAYIIMFLLALFGLALPDSWLTPLKPLSQANTLLSIFTIGLFMDFRLPDGKLGLILKTLASRYTAALVLSLLVYFLIPFPHLVKQVLLLIFFCPCPSFTCSRLRPLAMTRL
ncbi:AEC family transporter [Lactococcus termiticola]|uniref:Putative permease n=1 Tax=Lactococcus termiticola TaxID=2169526 RepID=A0A2R5HEZ9_9LACT|nr:AEC family transporter [Lactococcus termiticola]GBG96416.1 putative permease [Lactococcus termiticola]